MITAADFATYPDFPVPGILFYDIAPILASPALFRAACDALAPSASATVDLIAGVDARGFIFAPVVAQDLGVGMTMVRKKGKLPGELLEADATIEYGASELVMSPDGVEGKHVLVIDDVLATGGTAGAVAEMLERAGAADVSFSFLLEIQGLPGRERLSGHHVRSAVVV
jgi:adenine phosphoribosyltransferase